MIAFFVQHAFEAVLQELGNTPGICIEVFSQQRQGYITARIVKRIASAEGTVPLSNHRLLPLGVEAIGRWGKHLLPGLLHRTHKNCPPKSAPLLTQTGGNQAAVVTSFSQVYRFALEYCLGDGLGHSLWVRSIRYLLQTQTHLCDTGQERLQT